MSDYLTFDAVVEPLICGEKTYTIVPILNDVIAALPTGTKRIQGEFADHPINLALTKAPVIDGSFVYTGSSFLDEAGLTPGTAFEARIRPADPNAVKVPEDVMAALRAAGRSADWEALTPGKRRGMLHSVNTAKRAETRARRIAALIGELP
ncbi:MAG: YdeI/OmpD-associated family protein [Pseudomonadota bacterium]